MMEHIFEDPSESIWRIFESMWTPAFFGHNDWSWSAHSNDSTETYNHVLAIRESYFKYASIQL